MRDLPPHLYERYGRAVAGSEALSLAVDRENMDHFLKQLSSPPLSPVMS